MRSTWCLTVVLAAALSGGPAGAGSRYLEGTPSPAAATALGGGYAVVEAALWAVGAEIDERDLIVTAGLAYADAGSEGVDGRGPYAVRNSFERPSPGRPGGCLRRILAAYGYDCRVDPPDDNTLLRRVAAEIEAGRPVIARHPGSPHWQLVAGYDDEARTVRVSQDEHGSSWRDVPAVGFETVRLVPRLLPPQLILYETLRYTILEAGNGQHYILAEQCRDPNVEAINEATIRLFRVGRPALADFVQRYDDPRLAKVKGQVDGISRRAGATAGVGMLFLDTEVDRARIAAALEECYPRENLALRAVRSYLVSTAAEYVALAREHLAESDVASIRGFLAKLGARL